MRNRKLDVSTGAGGEVAVRRVRFDQHVNDCPSCRFAICVAGNKLWRDVCVEALRKYNAKTGAP